MSILINNTQFEILSGQIASLTGLTIGTSTTSISVTGQTPQSGNIGFSGLGGLVVSTGANNFIYFSGGASSSSVEHNDGINLSGQLYITGSTLYTYISNTSGNLQITGQATWNAARNNAINLSGNLSTTGSNLHRLITGFSGVFNNSGTQLQSQINTLKIATGYLASVVAPSLYIGSGSPEGVISATSGSIYTDYFNVLLYQKITGNSFWGWQ